MIYFEIDEQSRRKLRCEECLVGLERKRIKKVPSLQCPTCKATWSELEIRSGKAKGLMFRDS